MRTIVMGSDSSHKTKGIATIIITTKSSINADVNIVKTRQIRDLGSLGVEEYFAVSKHNDADRATKGAYLVLTKAIWYILT